jgi:HEAT repeat protein
LPDELLAILDQFDTEYTRNVEPKVQLISELAQHKSDEVRVALEPFVEDASEPVRFTTVTSLFAIGDEQSAGALVAALIAEESLRVKNRIAQGLAAGGWVIPEADREAAQQALPAGYALKGDKVVKR